MFYCCLKLSRYISEIYKTLWHLLLSDIPGISEILLLIFKGPASYASGIFFQGDVNMVLNVDYCSMIYLLNAQTGQEC